MFKSPFYLGGRIRRTEYGLSFILAISVIPCAVAIDIIREAHYSNVLYYILVIATVWFIVAQGVKRCHDIDCSGWYQFIPFYFFVLLFSDGNPNENRYGKNPKQIYTKSNEVDHTEGYYAGFPKRFAALMLDGLIAGAVGYALIFLCIQLEIFPYFPASLLFSAWYTVVLPIQYGGTPGKLIMGLQIINVSGEKINWNASLLRAAINLIIGVLGYIMTCNGYQTLPDSKIDAYPWYSLPSALMMTDKSLWEVLCVISIIWPLADTIVFFRDTKFRALHDYIAGTAVINTKVATQSSNQLRPTAKEENRNSQLFDFYISIDGKQFGPYQLTSMLEMIASGQIGSGTLVWKVGMPEWKAASEVPEFSRFFSIPPVRDTN